MHQAGVAVTEQQLDKLHTRADRLRRARNGLLGSASGFCSPCGSCLHISPERGITQAPISFVTVAASVCV